MLSLFMEIGQITYDQMPLGELELLPGPAKYLCRIINLDRSPMSHEILTTIQLLDRHIIIKSC